jgi:hypothetical protein
VSNDLISRWPYSVEWKSWSGSWPWHKTTQTNIFHKECEKCRRIWKWLSLLRKKSLWLKTYDGLRNPRFPSKSFKLIQKTCSLSNLRRREVLRKATYIGYNHLTEVVVSPWGKWPSAPDVTNSLFTNCSPLSIVFLYINRFTFVNKKCLRSITKLCTYINSWPEFLCTLHSWRLDLHRSIIC